MDEEFPSDDGFGDGAVSAQPAGFRGPRCRGRRPCRRTVHGAGSRRGRDLGDRLGPGNAQRRDNDRLFGGRCGGEDLRRARLDRPGRRAPAAPGDELGDCARWQDLHLQAARRGGLARWGAIHRQRRRLHVQRDPGESAPAHVLDLEAPPGGDGSTRPRHGRHSVEGAVRALHAPNVGVRRADPAAPSLRGHRASNEPRPTRTPSAPGRSGSALGTAAPACGWSATSVIGMPASRGSTRWCSRWCRRR